MDDASERLTCTLRNLPDAVCLTVAGEIDVQNAMVLKAHLRMAGQSETNTIIVDLSNLHYLDSSGIHVLLEGQRKLALGGRMIVLAAPSPSIRKVLSVLHLEELIPILPSVAEALTYLRAVVSDEPPQAGAQS